MKYFHLFDLPCCYEIDLPLLTERYLKLQKETQLGRVNDMGLSLELINKAYVMLRDDFTRAEYMLRHHGVTLESVSLDPDTMQSIWQENIALLDLTNDLEREGRINALQAKVKSFLSLALEDAERGELEKAACHLSRARFMKRCIEQSKKL
jgi:hypothetical protein